MYMYFFLAAKLCATNGSLDNFISWSDFQVNVYKFVFFLPPPPTRLEANNHPTTFDSHYLIPTPSLKLALNLWLLEVIPKPNILCITNTSLLAFYVMYAYKEMFLFILWTRNANHVI